MFSYHYFAYAMIALFVVSSIYPWDMTWPGAKWLAHLPLLQIPMWILYESSLPEGTNIRVDLLWIIPGMLVAAVAYFGKLAFLLLVENQELRNALKPAGSEKAGGATGT